MKFNKAVEDPSVPNIHGASNSKNYAAISVRGSANLETQLNQYHDQGYDLVEILSTNAIEDVECILYAQTSPTNPVNTTGNPVSRAYKVINPTGLDATVTLLNQYKDAGYKLLKGVKAGNSNILVLKR